MPAPGRLILIVDDDPQVARLISVCLQPRGFLTATVADGLRVVEQVRALDPALVLLDLSLPGRDGIEVCRELRQFSAVPIIMVTARADEGDRVLGLEVGADDYVCKGFSVRELVARVEALLRRAEGRIRPKRASGDSFEVDEDGQRIACGGEWLPLTVAEFRLLRQLVSRPGHVFTRGRLLELVRGDDATATDRAIDSHVKNLRRKIETLRPQGSGIASVYGVGYRFDG